MKTLKISEEAHFKLMAFKNELSWRTGTNQTLTMAILTLLYNDPIYKDIEGDIDGNK